MTTRAADTHCGNLRPHQPHRAWNTASADVCPGYPPAGIRQIWKDADKRLTAAGRVRLLVIVGMDETHASLRACDEAGTPISARLVRIRLDRLAPTSTGYEFCGMAA